MPFSEAYTQAYQNLPERLEQHYPNLSFGNHCYLRMALDHVIGDQLDIQINRPAYLHLSKVQLQGVVVVLQQYLESESLIHQHHWQSMAYRNARKKKQHELQF